MCFMYIVHCTSIRLICTYMFSETKTRETLLKQIFSVLENFTINLFRTNCIQTYIYVHLYSYIEHICTRYMLAQRDKKTKNKTKIISDNFSMLCNHLSIFMTMLTLIRVASQPTLKEWLVGILIPTDVGLYQLPNATPLVL